MAIGNSYIFLFNSYYNAPLPLLTPSDLPNHDEATQKLLASLLLHDIHEGLPSPMAPPGHARSHQPVPPIGLATGPPIPMSIDDIKRNTESFHSVFSGGHMYINGYVREYIFLVTFKSCNIVIKFRLLLVKPAKLLSQVCCRIVG
jgi:hypothetical protein